MKVELKESFNPIKIELIIETPEELERLHKLLKKNSNSIDDYNLIINVLNRFR